MKTVDHAAWDIHATRYPAIAGFAERWADFMEQELALWGDPWEVEDDIPIPRDIVDLAAIDAGLKSVAPNDYHVAVLILGECWAFGQQLLACRDLVPSYC